MPRSFKFKLRSLIRISSQNAIFRRKPPPQSSPPEGNSTNGRSDQTELHDDLQVHHDIDPPSTSMSPPSDQSQSPISLPTSPSPGSMLGTGASIVRNYPTSKFGASSTVGNTSTSQGLEDNLVRGILSLVLDIH